MILNRSLPPLLPSSLCLLVLVCFGLLIESASAAPLVINFQSQQHRGEIPSGVAIVGSVVQPGTYLLEQNKVLLSELLRRAGGLTENAGRKVQILSGGRTGVVLLYDPARDYQLHAGDIVIFEQAVARTSRTVSYTEQLAASRSAPGQTAVVRAQHQQPAASTERGHVVLLGFQPHPVVMPLWKPGLTKEELLVTWLKQPVTVADYTRVVRGKATPSGETRLTDGMVLRAPASLIDLEALPRLPEPFLMSQQSQSPAPDDSPLPEAIALPQEESPNAIPGPIVEPSTDESDNEESSELKPVTEFSPSQPDPVSKPSAETSQSTFGATLLIETDDSPNRTADSSIPPTDPFSAFEEDEQKQSQEYDPFTYSMLPGIEAEASQQTESEETETKKQSSAVSSQQASLAGSTWLSPEKLKLQEADQQHEEFHLASADEVVPAPVEPNPVEPATAKPREVSLVGFIAGSIVVIGVVTVIFASIRTHLGQPLHPLAKQHATEEEPRVAETPRRFPHEIKPVEHKPEPAAAVSSDHMQALANNQLPIIEEPAMLPRELKFFGKPQQHYELRVDGSHQTPRPHFLSKAEDQPAEPIPVPARQARQLTPEDVIWQGQFGLGEHASDIYDQS